jgi:hypothetical protein
MTVDAHEKANGITFANDGHRPTLQDDGHRPTLQDDGHRPTLQDDGHRPTLQDDGRRRTLQFIGSASVVSKVGWTPDDGGTVWIAGTGTAKAFKAGTSGFRPVPEEVWTFHIGGYQVCEKWLKDRGPKKGQPGRTLSAEDIAHSQKVVIALTETIRLMAEIDEVIESHGGWPGAFSTTNT